MPENRIVTVPESKIVFSEQTLAKLYEYCGEDEDLREQWDKTVEEARKHSFPKGMYTILPIETSDDEVNIGGHLENNAFMAENFGSIHRVFPFIATAGVELLEWSETVTDPIMAYMLDQLMNAVVGIAAAETRQAIIDEFHIEGRLSAMSPGSLDKWPIAGQRYLFELLGGQQTVKESIGVTLAPSMLMLPRKSVSSIGFETGEHNFQMCQFCSMPKCPNRRAKSMVDVQ